MKFDAEKHHRRSIRLPGYDYSSPGGCYITTVAFRRESLFGEIVNGEMQLNDPGEIARTIWEHLSERYPGLIIDEYVVMPNHFLGIIFIEDSRIGAIHELPRSGPPQSELPRPVDSETREARRIRRCQMLLTKAIGYFKMNSAEAINLLLDSTGVPIRQ